MGTRNDLASFAPICYLSIPDDNKAVSRRSRSLLRVQVKQEWFRDRGYVNRDILGKKIIPINIKELIIWNWRKKHGRLYLFAGHPVDSVACEGNGNTRRIRIQSNVSMFP